jgi:hypothetical protein
MTYSWRGQLGAGRWREVERVIRYPELTVPPKPTMKLAHLFPFGRRRMGQRALPLSLDESCQEALIMRLPAMTIRGWMMTVGALAIVMSSVSFDIDRAPDATSAIAALDLNQLMAWAVVVIPILLLLKCLKSPVKP